MGKREEIRRKKHASGSSYLTAKTNMTSMKADKKIKETWHEMNQNQFDIVDFL